MSYTITYNSDLRILEVTIQGRYALVEAKQVLVEAAEAIKKHDCFLLLADVRDVKLDISILELYDAPKLFNDTVSVLNISVYKLKRAVVIAKETPYFKFLETVVVNRGHMMKLFLDVEEARKWLLE